MSGSALRFPPVPGPGLALIEGAAATEQALLTLLLTEPGERAGRSRYGTGLRRFLHQPDNVATRTAIRQAVAEAIRVHLPSVQLLDVLISAAERPGLLQIDVRYRAPGELAARGLSHLCPLDPEAT